MPVAFSSRLKTLNLSNVHRYATLWAITRTDGVVLRFTDHDKNLPFEGNTYNAAIGFNVSATQRQAGLQEQNKEAYGMILPEGLGGVTYEDLRGGKYRQAEVVERLVDWQYPWAGAFYETKYIVLDMAFDGFTWRAEIVGQAKYLRMPVGKVYNRNCRHVFGSQASPGDPDDKCGVSLAGYTLARTVLTVTNTRKKFTVASITDDMFKYGVCIFKAGTNNAGHEVEIAKNASNEITLFIDVPYDIEVGDTVDIIRGCDKTFTTCVNTYSNGNSFGGYPHIPGPDRAVLIPNAKV